MSSKMPELKSQTAKVLPLANALDDAKIDIPMKISNIAFTNMGLAMPR